MTAITEWAARLEAARPETLTCEFMITTPMFIGDGDQAARSVRPPSLKGALRFWWRAMQWGSFVAQSANNTEALSKLHEEECRLFGAATVNDTGGQGVFSLRIKQSPTYTVISDWPKGMNSPCSFIGYGLWATKSTPQRQALPENQTFTAVLTWRRRTPDSDRRRITDALKALGLLGGLGSRARRGFGSLALTAVNDESLRFTSRKAYGEALKDLMTRYPVCPLERALFTCWTERSHVVFFGSAPDARQALSILDGLYKEMRKELSQKQKASMGLPLADYDTANRRSSPFVLHIHPVGDEFVAIISYLPADFHHADAYRTFTSEQMPQSLAALSAQKQEVLL